MLSPSNGNQANIIEAFKSQPQSGPTGSCNFIKIKGGSIKPDCHYVIWSLCGIVAAGCDCFHAFVLWVFVVLLLFLMQSI